MTAVTSVAWSAGRKALTMPPPRFSCCCLVFLQLAAAGFLAGPAEAGDRRRGPS